ncbi:ABC transporter permease [Psychrosphaera haliotis]|uniref:Transport permease protein n=1 Tax=Psychrosphaera haliotis TaxID=555083 RepID=A0A6N8F415_9GAMM|nr:ABC transporter permease [Psychrosphaera haliotis]MUH71315.1 ABC transporter permease subunit [Psychrosphaera haliotis]
MKVFFTRFYAILKARNLEFFRDRSSLAWSVIFPVLLLVGFAVVFSGDGKDVYKVGVLTSESSAPSVQPHPFLQTKYIEFVDYKDPKKALSKLHQHRLDLLVDFEKQQYWLNESSPNGYFVEKLLLASSLSVEKGDSNTSVDGELDSNDKTSNGLTTGNWQQQTVDGRQIRYLDWVLPGILGMNMMFSCLFGVGYVIVRYRKNMVLKRLNATPVTALEFLTAQIVSRLMIVMFLSSMVFIGCDLLFDFYMLGSYLDLLVIAILGAFALISLGLMIASRSRSEELTGGLLNLATWPMMILSGVWFSLEGSPEFIQTISMALPLTHLVEGARAIMTEGASLMDIKHHVFTLLGMIVVFLTAGTLLFRWEGDGR